MEEYNIFVICPHCGFETADYFCWNCLKEFNTGDEEEQEEEEGQSDR
jgi:hypothetical protein